MSEDTGITEATEATEATEEGDAAPQLSQTGEEEVKVAAEPVTKEQFEQLLAEMKGFKEMGIAERRKRQDVEARLEALSKKEEPVVDLPDDDIVMGKDVKKFLAQKDKENELKDFQKAYKDCYTQVSKNEDYEEVIALAADLIENDPEYSDMREVILFTKSGPRVAYNLGKLHPKYAKKVEAGIKKQTADTIAKNLNSPKTLTGVQGGSNQTIDDVKRIKNMSDKEFEEYTNKMLGVG